MKRSLSLSNYWWCQLLGWGAVTPYWYFYESKGGFPFYLVLLSVFSQAGLQIFVTDQYRRLVHRRKWLGLPLKKLLPVVFVAWLILTAQYMLMAYTVFSLRYDHSYFANDTFLGALAGGSRYHAIWLLAFHLYHFARQSANQQVAAAEARLAKLSNDLNPHFLFNALNGIKGLTREDPAKAREAIDRLAELLRYSLRRSAQLLVPLREELEIIGEYIGLEQMRLEERLSVQYNFTDVAESCFLPPLSLHTLVENAVKHGISRIPEGGVITIELDKKDSYWVFTVQNPCPSALIHHTSSVGSGTTSAPHSTKLVERAQKPTGTGLNNLRQRLSLQFHNDATLNTEHNRSFFTATLRIPL